MTMPPPFSEVIDGKLVVHFHPGQQQAWYCTKRFPVVVAGTQGGKTCFGPHWLYREMVQRGPGDYGIITATFPLLNLKLLPECLDLFQHKLHLGVYRDSDKLFECKGGPLDKARIIFGSATNPESIESATMLAAWLDECLAPETMIATEGGCLSIRQIVEERLAIRVWSYDTLEGEWQLRPVCRWIRLPQREPLLECGPLRITPRHQIWTEQGYVDVAQILSAYYSDIRAERVYDESLRELPKHINQARPEKVLQCQVRCNRKGQETRLSSPIIRPFQRILQRPCTPCPGFRTASGSVFRRVEATLGAEGWRGNAPHTEGEGPCIAEYPAQSAMEIRGEWPFSQLEARETCQSVGLGERVCGHNGQGLEAPCLQDRRCRADLENSYRSGQCSQSRQEGMVQSQWLDISTLLKQDGRGLAGGLSSNGFVYNLEVEDNHNYVADGILVANCGQKQFKLQAKEAIDRRLSIHQGRALYTTTPYCSGWLQDFATPGRYPDVEVIHFDSVMNPAFPKEEFERAQASMPLWRFNMFYRGMFDKPAGLIYDCFDEATVINRFPIPDSWLWYSGHDFGATNPAALFYAQDPATGYFYAVHEYLPGAGRTVAEHVTLFKALTQGRTVLQRRGGSHQEDGPRGEFTAHGWPISEPKVHDVELGISRVYALHKLKKLFVFRDCMHYLDEKRRYSRVLNDRYEPTDAIEDKSDFHLLDCLVSGTMVATENGLMAIENIGVGVRLLTRKGYFPVRATIAKEGETVRASFSNGVSLIGSPNHKVFTNNRGWVSLDSLRYGDIIETWQAIPSSSRELSITAIRTPSDGQTGCTSGMAPGGYIGSFGKMPMGRFLKAMISTTKTAIHSITTSPIWNVKKSISTMLATWLITPMTSTTLLGYAPSRQRGIVPQREGHGTSSTARLHGKGENPLPYTALSVDEDTRQSSLPTASFAQMLAGLRLATPAGVILKPGHVRSAGPCFLPTNTQEQGAAQGDVVRCLGVEPFGRARLYDLNVDIAGEYYANGLLVHNSERYILADFTPESVVSEQPKVHYY